VPPTVGIKSLTTGGGRGRFLRSKKVNRFHRELVIVIEVTHIGVGV
jgi:hypothetical protein